MWTDLFDKSVIVRPDFDALRKGRLKVEPASVRPKSHFVDPLATFDALGYKENRYSGSYDLLRAIPSRLAVVAAVIQTRCNQIASFSQPFRTTKSVGFQIRHKNSARETTESERKFILDMEQFIYNCGHKKPNKFFPKPRDSFEDFLKKIVRDTLTLDQVTCEIIPDRLGRPYEFLAVDAATIRIASPDVDLDGNLKNKGKTTDREYSDKHVQEEYDPDQPAFVQVINGKIENTYTREELVFAVRNPRSDIAVHGYGLSELELLMNTITAHLWAEEYNRKAFSQGSMTKGILNMKGDTMSGEMLESFRREWRDSAESVSNAFRTPILQVENGIEWIPLQTSNREMEYGAWLEYLIKMISSVFLIDPAELNFDMHGGQQNTPLFESSQEWKLKASRDKGLRPLLRFIAKIINDNIVSRIDDNYVFTFEGLDELSEKDKHDLRKEQVASYMTLNEIRKAEDLPAIEYGDVPLNPTYIQARQSQMQEKQQQEQQQPAPVGGGSAPQGAQPQQATQDTSYIPKYSG